MLEQSASQIITKHKKLFTVIGSKHYRLLHKHLQYMHIYGQKASVNEAEKPKTQHLYSLYKCDCEINCKCFNCNITGIIKAVTRGCFGCLNTPEISGKI